MYQRTPERHSPHLAFSSTRDRVEAEREGDDLADQADPAWPETSSAGSDHLLLFESMDFEGKRVDLPCDDDGQVFLAPVRHHGEAADDGSVTPFPVAKKIDTTADQVKKDRPSAGHALLVDQAPPGPDDDVLMKAEPEWTSDPVDEASELPLVRRQIVTEAPDQTRTPMIEARFPIEAPGQGRASVQEPIRSRWSECWAGGLAFAASIAAGMAIGIRACLDRFAEAARISALGIVGGVAWLYGCINRWTRAAAMKTALLIAHLLARADRMRRLLVARQPSLIKSVKAVASAAWSVLLSGLRALSKASMTKGRQAWIAALRWVRGASLVGVREARKAGPIISAAMTYAFEKTTKAGSQLRRYLTVSGGSERGSLQPWLARAASIAKGGKQRALATSLLVLGACRTLPDGVRNMRLAGLAAGCACVLLVVTVWSGSPESKLPSVVLPFPEKPLRGGLAKDVGADAESLPTRSVASSADDESQASLSPEAAIAKLTAVVAPSGTLAASSPSEPSLGAAGSAAAPAGTGAAADARLAVLTIMADIESIPGLGEFARAVRTVGLETLIQPGRPYTFLAPTDAAFAKLGKDRLAALFAPGGHDQLRALLSNHIIEERLLFSNFAGEIGTYSSLADQAITITAVDVIKVEQAAMIETDLRAANTVIHVIDELLLPRPPSGNDASPSAAVIKQASES